MHRLVGKRHMLVLSLSREGGWGSHIRHLSRHPFCLLLPKVLHKVPLSSSRGTFHSHREGIDVCPNCGVVWVFFALILLSCNQMKKKARVLTSVSVQV